MKSKVLFHTAWLYANINKDLMQKLIFTVINLE
jgi:hypothetical protein